MAKLQWDCLRINAHLMRKYDIHFNFFLTKPITEIVYNQTYAPTTIAFKDAALLADTNEYLKRYYFLKNALDKDEIFDRVRLLAQFYGGAVILRYEYPLMIITNTKSLFLKRLKRMKKMLVEEGSSDQSKSCEEQKAVSINSSQFLRSVNSSELQKKSMDEYNLQLDFSLLKETQYQLYDIYEAPQEQAFPNQSGFNIISLAKSLAVQLVLGEEKEEDLSHLLVDFDEIDGEEVVKKYQKWIQKQNLRQSSKQSTIRKTDSIIRSTHSKNPLKIRQLLERKPMASSITITALQDHIDPHRIPQQFHPADNFKKKSMLSPTRPSQRQQQQHLMKRSSYYQYQTDHQNFPLANEMVIAEDEMEQSPKNFQKRIKKFPSMDQQDFNGVGLKHTNFSLHKKNQQMQQESLTPRDHLQQKQQKEPLQQYGSANMKYSSILNESSKQRDPFARDSYLQGQRFSNLPHYRGQAEQYPYKSNQGPFEPNGMNRYSNLSQPNRMTSINININNLQEKKDTHRVNVKFNGSKNKYNHGQDFAEEERNYRAEKKRKIREKAEALLTRVKSQEYMRSGEFIYDREMELGEPNKDGRYFQRYF